jgi:hypothetical protein
MVVTGRILALRGTGDAGNPQHSIPRHLAMQNASTSAIGFSGPSDGLEAHSAMRFAGERPRARLPTVTATLRGARQERDLVSRVEKHR